MQLWWDFFFLDPFIFYSALDSQLNEHLQHVTVSRYTSSTNQNGLAECMYYVDLDNLKKNRTESSMYNYGSSVAISLHLIQINL